MTGREAVSYRLGPPPEPPAPAPGCPSCADVARRRARAQAAGDYSRVSDCNIWLRRHAFHAPPST